MAIRLISVVWLLLWLPTGIAAVAKGRVGLAIFIVVVALGGAGFYEVRLARARLVVSPSEVVIHNPFKSLHLDRATVVSCELRQVGPRLREAFVVSGDGRAVGAWGLRQGPRTDLVGSMVDEINKLLRERPAA